MGMPPIETLNKMHSLHSNAQSWKRIAEERVMKAADMRAALSHAGQAARKGGGLPEELLAKLSKMGVLGKLGVGAAGVGAAALGGKAYIDHKADEKKNELKRDALKALAFGAPALLLGAQNLKRSWEQAQESPWNLSVHQEMENAPEHRLSFSPKTRKATYSRSTHNEG